MTMNDGLIDEMDEIAEIVAETFVDDIDFILDRLAPDGRPFGMELPSINEQAREYVRTLRGNAYGWAQWVRERAMRIMQGLTGAAPDQIAGIHPWDIAYKLALYHSNRMEQHLRQDGKRAQKADAFEPSGSVPEATL